MKKPWSYRQVFLVVALSLLVNSLILLLFWDRVKITSASIISIFLASVYLLSAVLVCLKKHTPDAFEMRHRHSLKNWRWEDCSEEVSDEEEREFRFAMLVYWSVIPFYLPIIFFSTHFAHGLFSLLLVYLPQIVYFVQSIKHTRKFMREMHERDVRERKEQEAREEMGRWK